MAAQRDEAAFAYRGVALKAFQEVEDTLASIQRLDERRQALAEEVDAYATALRVSTERYQDGYAPYLDQIDAQNVNQLQIAWRCKWLMARAMAFSGAAPMARQRRTRSG